MERNPHLLIEGCAIGCYAIGAKVAYIYIRGEFYHVQHVLEAAIAEAYAPGFLGKNILGSRLRLRGLRPPRRRRLRGGEETALSSRSRASAPSRASSRRSRRSSASTAARRRSTTSRRSATCRSSSSTAPSGSRRSGPRRTAAPSSICVSGHVKRPGRLRGVDEHHAARADLRRQSAGGMRDGRHVQGGHPRRLVGADAAAAISSTRRPASTAS